MLLAWKKEWSLESCYNVDETWKYNAKWKKLDMTGHILCDVTDVKYLDQGDLERENWLVVCKVLKCTVVITAYICEYTKNTDLHTYIGKSWGIWITYQ